MDDLPLNKIQISGPTLAAMIQRFLSSSGDIDGLLFGRVTQITTANFSDDTPTNSSSSESPTIEAIVTSFVSFNSNSTFYDSSGDISAVSLQRLLSSFSDQLINHSLIGWFSGRRKTLIRPSLRESLVTASLSSDIQFSLQVENSSNSYTFFPPCVFLLFTTPIQEQLIHTHEYRAYQFRYPNDSFEPKTLDVVNIGPVFRGHYNSFSPNSSFPAIQCELKGFSSMAEDGKVDGECLKDIKKLGNDQKELDMLVEGFEISRLGKLMGPEAAHYTAEIDHLYEKMLVKLDGLARLVEKSSIKVLEQENLNSKLRFKVAGTETDSR
ncbi:uncharacterized protein LOC124934179 [Impatiens glandulifera]|uniref:uncharacterized protein LOC124934179 n=1 Tax=Impatiens glandulifera TaxID=253017 RepID=UPI001FB0E664|nr:uncharacterized protein LOC124934179 [Impatiens glandulifera]